MDELKGICKNCLGCNKLEYTGFRGICTCDSYRSSEGENDKNKNNQIKLKGDNYYDESF